MVVVDPRATPVAQEADVHLPIRPGTNLALLNAIIHELLANDWYDLGYVHAHTIGLEDLERVTSDCPPGRAAQICDVDESLIRAAAEIIGTSERLLSTVLQGFYQANQATASACQVNNIHLLRGMLGRPGAGVLQMNGQPTAQNTRETGADGDLSGFRNWNNPDHIAELARLWNVDQSTIPHWAPPTHAMQIFRYAELSSIELLWISATNPAVSMPDLGRIRKILGRSELFVVVQDAFATETTAFADVVLPAALWGEKLGTFTNADRTVHLSERAIEPPGDARSDLDIFLDYARRMDFRDRDGGPLVKWHDPESAFEAWKQCSRGRPCDYSAMTYELLRGGSGIQWPCTSDAPLGTERLYGDAHFPTDPDYCETYGHDLATGVERDETSYRAEHPDGRAFLRATSFEPGPEVPDDDFPFTLTTGRTIYHFHTRTKSARAPELQDAAPDVWAELCQRDAARLGAVEGDVLRVSSRRGCIEAPLRITGVRAGVVFVPFHYGSWDRAGRSTDAPRAANELTLVTWDPVSKQPMFKRAAVQVAVVRTRDR
jgi:anaerobic selenocysteine-containing dehydrogenase